MIANPAAGRGRGARVLPALREAMLSAGARDVRLTASAGDEQRLARLAAIEGIDTIVAMGGDGTWGNVARGILESGRDARLAIIPAGTGNDFGQALGLPVRDVRALVAIATGEREMRVDMGSADSRPFLNVAGFGIETSVVQSTQRIKRLSGPLVYVAAALPLLRTFVPLEAELHVESANVVRSSFLAIVFSNGPRFGGGFRVAPEASVADGLLDMVAVRDAKVMRRARLLLDVRMGRHATAPEVHMERVRRVMVRFAKAPLLDLDGDLHEASGAEVVVRVLEKALRVAV